MSDGVAIGIAVCLIGLMGGGLGTWNSYRNANGPRECRFVIRAAVALLVGISLFLFLLFCLPYSYRCCAWIPYGILLPLAIIHLNKRQQQIREQESEG